MYICTYLCSLSLYVVVLHILHEKKFDLFLLGSKSVYDLMNTNNTITIYKRQFNISIV